MVVSTIDSVSGSSKIAELWKNHFFNLLNEQSSTDYQDNSNEFLADDSNANILNVCIDAAQKKRLYSCFI